MCRVLYYINCETVVSRTLVQGFSSFHEEALWHFHSDEYLVGIRRDWNEGFCFLPRGVLHWLIVASQNLGAVAVPRRTFTCGRNL